MLRELWVAALRRIKGLERSATPSGFGYSGYESFRASDAARRNASYQCRQQPGLISLLTTVWNTDSSYLHTLADSVAAQQGGTDFEWVILDNGSTNPDTVKALSELSSRPYIRLHSVPQNIGIIGGMRYCLEHATGRYILPVDSDDYLYPDSVKILTWHITRNAFPALLYTDEDKLRDESFVDPYFKPDWDPVLFVDSCYIAHLCAIDRERALQLGVYTDAAAEGSHDGDTFMRFHLSGHVPFHISEVLYSWRMHPQSTASNMASKDYIHASQKAVLKKFLDAQPAGTLHEIHPSPFFAGTPDWWVRRRHERPRPLTTILLRDAADRDESPTFDYPGWQCHTLSTTDRIDEMKEAVREVATLGGMIHLLWNKVRLDRADWMWCALSIMELFPDTAAVGGPVYRKDGIVVAAGAYFGFGRGCDSPDRGRSIAEPGYFAQMWKQHSVSAVSSQNMVVDAGILLDFLDERREKKVSFPYLGAWLGAYARRRGRRTVYTPFLRAICTSDWETLVPNDETDRFVACHADLVPEAHYLSPLLGLTPKTAYLPVTESTRTSHLAQLFHASRERRQAKGGQ